MENNDFTSGRVRTNRRVALAGGAMLLLSSVIPAVGARAQGGTPPPISPEIGTDGKVTFRLRAPHATGVIVSGDWDHYVQHPLAKDEATGDWSVILDSITPDVYGYSFQVDGISMVDPGNRHTKPARSVNTSILDVPGAKPTPCDPQSGIEWGTVHLHDYESPTLGIRRLRVYTPSGYDKDRRKRYPVLYLLHGSGDNEATWTEFGRANIILDNLIAAAKVMPMIVVMTDGHASIPGEPRGTGRSIAAYEEDLLNQAMPLVESLYRIEKDRDHRAIAGLSMGGYQSLTIGLNYRDRFSWIGGMSSDTPDEKALTPFLSNRADEDKRYPIHLLWVADGKNDFLLPKNREFDAFLTQQKIPHEYIETEGYHYWVIWRQYLAILTPRLFLHV